MTQLETPVAFVIFNRPEPTLRVFEEIRKVRPKTLFILADGPRTPDEKALCNATRAITETIDWECDVRRRYLDTNLGVKGGVSSGISWVFEQVERAIILEDDCVPHPDFFPYCTELLERYKDDERIMHISGDNFQQLNPDFHPADSYYFSIIPHVWGWATWRRAWEKYDVDISIWPEVEKNGLLKNAFTDAAVQDRWEYRFRQYYRGEIKSWDGQWVFACLINNGLCINPAKNLVTNVGFGNEAQSTKNATSSLANIPVYPISWPLIHPHSFLSDRAADAYTYKFLFGIQTRLSDKVLWFVKNQFPYVYACGKKLRSLMSSSLS